MYPRNITDNKFLLHNGPRKIKAYYFLVIFFETVFVLDPDLTIALLRGEAFLVEEPVSRLVGFWGFVVLTLFCTALVFADASTDHPLLFLEILRVPDFLAFTDTPSVLHFFFQRDGVAVLK
jgi:hypothetical protein